MVNLNVPKTTADNEICIFVNLMNNPFFAKDYGVLKEYDYIRHVN